MRATQFGFVFLAFIFLGVVSNPCCLPEEGSTTASDALSNGFAHPPDEAKLRCYWWWLNGHTDEQTITNDLEQMKQKGYGGAILVDGDGSGQGGNDEVPAGPMFGTPAWTRLYVHALKEAARLHLEISLNIMSGWNLGGPRVTPDQASKVLTWSRVDVRSGDVRQPLPLPPIRNGYYREIAVLAYPLHHGPAMAGDTGSNRRPIHGLAAKSAAKEAGFSMPDTSSLLVDGTVTPGEQDTDLTQVQDVSKFVKDGVLHWQAPTGDWEIFCIGYTDSDARVSTASGKWQGLAIDYMDHHAFDSYWSRSVEPLLQAGKPYVGVSLKYLVTDSWELGGANWTAAFREQFKALRGYDPVPWLPVVAGRIVENRDSSVRFLNDLRRTIGDLIVSEHYDAFAQHAKRWGLGIHPESGGPHGAPIDALETFRSAAFPQTEFWAKSESHRIRDSDRFFVKEASSAAHIYGKRFIAQEGETSVGPQWNESLAEDLKPTFDRALTEGMNRLVWHEFTSSPNSMGMPGQEYFAGTHLNPNVTWWAQADAFLAYLNRSQFLLQQGEPVVDLLYFYGDEVPNFVRLKADDPAHLLPGYDYDVTNEDALLHSIRIDNGQLVSPGGIRYRALAMPSTKRTSLASLRRVAEFVHAGGTVLGPKPDSPTGRASDADMTAFSRLANNLWGDCKTTSHTYGAGHAFCSSDAHALLAQLDVPRDFQADDGGLALDYIHRRQGDTDIYFVRNGSAHAVHTTAAFRVTGRTPELWDAVTGRTAVEMLYVENDSLGTTRVPLRLPAYGSIFVVFRTESGPHVTSLMRGGSPIVPKNMGNPDEPVITRCANAYCLHSSEPGEYDLVHSDGRHTTLHISSPAEPLILTGEWSLSFQHDRGGPDRPMTITELKDWSTSTDPHIRYFSGTALYKKTFEMPPAQPGQRVLLELTRLFQICTVNVNGKDAGTIWALPYQLDITNLLQSGTNHVELTVTNLWANRIIGDQQPGTTHAYTHTNIRAYNSNSPLLPSGLDGPVKLITEGNFPESNP